MSTSEELRMRARLAVRAGCGTEVIFNRAADELDALQAKLGRVRALCADRVDKSKGYNESVRFVAWDVLEIINDDGPSEETLARWAGPTLDEKGGGE